jgi:mersacidin/lichenicidin family type 2 lantibiotic
MKLDIVRAWKDEAYRASLNPEEQALLPQNPAGGLALSDSELETIHGARPGPNVGGNGSSGCTAGRHLVAVVACLDSSFIP